jgi:hypothetical protein
LDIRSIPTLIIFKNGQESARLPGDRHCALGSGQYLKLGACPRMDDLLRTSLAGQISRSFSLNRSTIRLK